jgi:hypothetical protein
MSLSYHDMNIDRVCIRYATDNDNNDELCGVMVRGINEDIMPLLDPEAHILDRIRQQIGAAREWRDECQRKDEGAPLPPVEFDMLAHAKRVLDMVSKVVAQCPEREPA